MGWDEEAETQAGKLVEREHRRLRKSFEMAKADGLAGWCRRIICGGGR